MSGRTISTGRVCENCAAIFPTEWPRDRVLESRTLGPVDCARHILVFTRILHGVRLDKLHDECVVDCINWLRDVRSASKSLKVNGVTHKLLDVWMELSNQAREALQYELRERPEVPPPSPDEVKRALRIAMEAVGWRDIGVSIDPNGSKVRVLYPQDPGLNTSQERANLLSTMRDVLGPDVFDRLEIRFRQRED